MTARQAIARPLLRLLDMAAISGLLDGDLRRFAYVARYRAEYSRRGCARGLRLVLFPTFRCSLACEYCVLKILSGRMPQDPPGTPCGCGTWVDWLSRFPIPITFITFSGGEPTINEDVLELIYWTAHTARIPCRVTTNMSNANLCRVPSTWRLAVSASFHHAMPRDLFERNLAAVKAVHPNCWAEEIAEQRRPETEKLKPLVTEAPGPSRGAFMVGPDLLMFRSCGEIAAWYGGVPIRESMNCKGTL